VLEHVGPQPTYRIGGVTALAAAIVLMPLLRLRQEHHVPGAGSSDEDVAAHAEPVGEVIAGEVPRYASAEALEAATYPEPGRRTA
jgi:hypothetical protein